MLILQVHCPVDYVNVHTVVSDVIEFTKPVTFTYTYIISIHSACRPEVNSRNILEWIYIMYVYLNLQYVVLRNDNLKHNRKHTDHVRKGDFAS